MNKILFFDTETTGLPEWKIPSEDPIQPHIVQLGAITADADSHNIMQSLDVIVKPDGWVIPENTIELHGITQERAMDEGIPEAEALERFIQLWSGRMRVAHNRTFDQRIIRIAMKRYCPDPTTELWASKDDFDCTMLISKNIMKLPSTGNWKYKSPNLKEAYKYFTGKDLAGAHNAMADTKACMEIYWKLKEIIR